MSKTRRTPVASDSLQPGCFGTEFSQDAAIPEAVARFGLRTGQMRYDGKMGHNASWYNHDGVKVGWGDLSADDVVRIASQLREGETFVVCPESMFWKHVTHNPGPTGAWAVTAPQEQQPGADLLCKEAMFLITAGQVHYRDVVDRPAGQVTNSEGVSVPTAHLSKENFTAVFNTVMTIRVRVPSRVRASRKAGQYATQGRYR